MTMNNNNSSGLSNSHLGRFGSRRNDQYLNHGDHNSDPQSKQEVLDSVHVSILDRIDHFTWANFTFPMATGGIALLLSSQPHNFPHILTLGKIVHQFDLVIFTLLTLLISIRFVRHPAKLWTSLTHPTEGLLFPTFALCVPTLVGCMSKYGVPASGMWLVTGTEVLFWMYAGVTFVIAVLQYLLLFTGRQLTIQSMTPAWLLPVFPVMLSGTIANIIAPTLSDTRRLSVLVAGLTFQGLGFWVAILMYSGWIVRLMEAGLPAPALRPGMFIAVGPPSFTGLALIGMARALPEDHTHFIAHPDAIDTMRTIAVVFAIFAWSLSFWFFCISALSCLAAVPHMDFHLVWYAFVFPNVGFTIAVIEIGVELASQGVIWVGSVMSVLLVIMWVFVMVMHARAVVRGDVMWPGKDEDKDQ